MVSKPRAEETAHLAPVTEAARVVLIPQAEEIAHLVDEARLAAALVSVRRTTAADAPGLEAWDARRAAGAARTVLPASRQRAMQWAADLAD